MADRIMLGTVLASNGKYYSPVMSQVLKPYIQGTFVGSSRLHISSPHNSLILAFGGTNGGSIFDRESLVQTNKVWNHMQGRVFESPTFNKIIWRANYYTSDRYTNYISMSDINGDLGNYEYRIGTPTSTSTESYIGFNVIGDKVLYKTSKTATVLTIASAVDLTIIRTIPSPTGEFKFTADESYIYAYKPYTLIKRDIITGDIVSTLPMIEYNNNDDGLLEIIGDYLYIKTNYSNSMLYKINKNTLEVVSTRPMKNFQYSIHKGVLYITDNPNQGIVTVNMSTLEDDNATDPIVSGSTIRSFIVQDDGFFVAIGDVIYKLLPKNEISDYKEVL